MGETIGNDPSDSLKPRLIIVSNRLPVVLNREKDGKWSAVPGSEGFVTALAPVLRDRGGLWIGWLGTVEASGK
jgi:trehalose 6-phosphate synthase